MRNLDHSRTPAPDIKHALPQAFRSLWATSRGSPDRREAWGPRDPAGPAPTLSRGAGSARVSRPWREAKRKAQRLICVQGLPLPSVLSLFSFSQGQEAAGLLPDVRGRGSVSHSGPVIAHPRLEHSRLSTAKLAPSCPQGSSCFNSGARFQLAAANVVSSF